MQLFHKLLISTKTVLLKVPSAEWEWPHNIPGILWPEYQAVAFQHFLLHFVLNENMSRWEEYLFTISALVVLFKFIWHKQEL